MEFYMQINDMWRLSQLFVAEERTHAQTYCQEPDFVMKLSIKFRDLLI